MKNKTICVFVLLTVLTTLIFFVNYKTTNKVIKGCFDFQWAFNNDGNCKLLQTSPNILDSQIFIKNIDGNISLSDSTNIAINNKSKVIIAIVDGGINTLPNSSKIYLWNNVNEINCDSQDNDKNGYVDDVFGWDFVNNKPLEEDNQKLSGHGTSCYSIMDISAEKAGISSKNISFMPLKVFDNSDEGYIGNIQNIIQAIKYAEDNGAKICNISLNTKEYNQELYDTIKNSNMLFIVAAGNGLYKGCNIDHEKNYTYPACFDCENIICVANLNHNGKLNRYSNFGEKMVDIAAPGTDIYVYVDKEENDCVSGTSFSVPFVSFTAGIVKLYNSEFTSIEVKNRVLTSAKYNINLQQKVKESLMLDYISSIN